MEKKKTAKKMTSKQEDIFEFIKDNIQTSGYPPTVREIGEKFNITVKGAYDHMKAIEKKGFIRTDKNKSRAINIVSQCEPAHADSLAVPLLGRIAAGAPIMAEENIDEYLSFPKSYFGSGQYFALNVKGDSMINCGILDGDIAILKKQETANNGDIIAALLEDEATLKKFKLVGNRVHLIPENDAYKPIITEKLSILGKLAGVFRRY